MLQHLIDPEVCIRCNACEESCTRHAVRHDGNNYVVDPAVCGGCRDCLPTCPTGAIDHWHEVATPYSLSDQFSWLELPPAGVGAMAAEDGGIFTRAAPLRARVVADRRLTAEGAATELRLLVLDIGAAALPIVEGQSVGVLVPGRDAQGRVHPMRLYSLACGRDGEGGVARHVSLLVKRETGGLCSNYLCDLAPGREIELVGPFGRHFLLPDDAAVPLVMVCTGSGFAPFRGFLQRRLAQPGGAAAWLYCGARTPQETPCLDWLRALPPHRAQVHTAFSRVPGAPRRHVQDAMIDTIDTLLPLLERSDTHLYLCGVKTLEAGIDERLAPVCAARGRSWSALKQVLQREGRLRVEVF